MALTGLAGVALAMVASDAIFEDWNSYMRVLSWMPLGIWFWAVQTGRSWPIWLLTPAAIWPFIATPQGWSYVSQAVAYFTR